LGIAAVGDSGPESRYFMAPYNKIILALTLKVPKRWRPKLLKLAGSGHPRSFEATHHGTLTYVRMNVIPSEVKSTWTRPTFLPLIVGLWVFLLSSFRGEVRKTPHLYNSVRYGRLSLPRSSKVDYGIK